MSCDYHMGTKLILATILQLLLMLPGIDGDAQTDTISIFPSEFIIPVKDSEQELIEELEIAELRAMILEHDCIVIGETHGARESTEIIQQIAQIKSFDHFITEIDSFSIEFISENIDHSDTILKELPGVFSMYSYKEELELLRILKGKGASLSGIDQAHPLAVRLILLELSKSEQLKARSVRKIEALIERHSKDLTKGYLSSKTEKRSIKLLSRMQDECSYQEAVLLEFALYQLKRQYSMGQRAEYMIKRLADLTEKHNFTESKVLFKFGASHTLKTKNTAGLVDIGAYLTLLCDQQLPDPYFLTIIPLSGSIGFPLEINGKRSKRYDLSSSPYQAMYNLFGMESRGLRSFFVDVESFRKSLNDQAALSAELETVLQNYDGMLFIDQVSPSRPYIDSVP